MATKTENPALVAEKKKREIASTFAALIDALNNEAERLRAVDIYLNDEGKSRLHACETIRFLAAFCDTAADLADLELYDELGEDADAVRDVLMAIERIEKLEKEAEK